MTRCCGDARRASYRGGACRKCGRTRPLCPACGLRIVNTRGLCRVCRNGQLAAGLLEPSQFAGSREIPDFNGPGLPCEPCDARPGSEAKLAALEQRAAAGQRLWHVADAGPDID
jgi:hypothetical protein